MSSKEPFIEQNSITTSSKMEQKCVAQYLESSMDLLTLLVLVAPWHASFLLSLPPRSVRQRVAVSNRPWRQCVNKLLITGESVTHCTWGSTYIIVGVVWKFNRSGDLVLYQNAHRVIWYEHTGAKLKFVHFGGIGRPNTAFWEHNVGNPIVTNNRNYAKTVRHR